jgi:hypothetical protein
MYSLRIRQWGEISAELLPQIHVCFNLLHAENMKEEVEKTTS